MRTQGRQSKIAVVRSGDKQKPVLLWAELGIVVKRGRASVCSLIEKGMRDTPLSWYVKYISICIYKCVQFLGVRVRTYVHIWSSARHFQAVGYSN